MDSLIFVENVFLHGNSIIFRKRLLIREAVRCRILVHRNADAFFQIVGKKEEKKNVEIFRKVIKIKRERCCLLGNRKGMKERNKLNHL